MAQAVQASKYQGLKNLGYAAAGVGIFAGIGVAVIAMLGGPTAIDITLDKLTYGHRNEQANSNDGFREHQLGRREPMAFQTSPSLEKRAGVEPLVEATVEAAQRGTSRTNRLKKLGYDATATVAATGIVVGGLALAVGLPAVVAVAALGSLYGSGPAQSQSGQSAPLHKRGGAGPEAAEATVRDLQVFVDRLCEWNSASRGSQARKDKIYLAQQFRVLGLAASPFVVIGALAMFGDGNGGRGSALRPPQSLRKRNVARDAPMDSTLLGKRASLEAKAEVAAEGARGFPARLRRWKDTTRNSRGEAKHIATGVATITLFAAAAGLWIYMMEDSAANGRGAVHKPYGPLGNREFPGHLVIGSQTWLDKGMEKDSQDKAPHKRELELSRVGSTRLERRGGESELAAKAGDVVEKSDHQVRGVVAGMQQAKEESREAMVDRAKEAARKARAARREQLRERWFKVKVNAMGTAAVLALLAVPFLPTEISAIGSRKQINKEVSDRVREIRENRLFGKRELEPSRQSGQLEKRDVGAQQAANVVGEAAREAGEIVTRVQPFVHRAREAREEADLLEWLRRRRALVNGRRVRDALQVGAIFVAELGALSGGYLLARYQWGKRKKGQTMPENDAPRIEGLHKREQQPYEQGHSKFERRMVESGPHQLEKREILTPPADTVAIRMVAFRVFRQLAIGSRRAGVFAMFDDEEDSEPLPPPRHTAHGRPLRPIHGPVSSSDAARFDVEVTRAQRERTGKQQHDDDEDDDGHHASRIVKRRLR
ncbi:hypothetical protein EX895_005117 [Sporisorium graminicola]|uniref:Transmembrane protein n=1 Tax=Sporisorium graminicola TaxID=280036 RepID=A0A4U7KTH8_9BASI|nr:hypothetical protein EX895_005117 [Sporisorium graminicola]TKY86292.1 hypothetical protein EX895_005117 [Sporisorium graminicola]